MNIGEELVAAYLQHIKGCDFTQQNLYTSDVQGEIDVVGIRLAPPKTIYVCEVAIHLATGLLYTKGSRPNNVKKLSEKFSRNIEFAEKYFPDYQKHFMLWSPVVKQAKPDARLDQQRDIDEIASIIQKRYSVEIEMVVNEDFQMRFDELRQYAQGKSEELKNPVLRLFQIEEALKRHLAKRAKGKK